MSSKSGAIVMTGGTAGIGLEALRLAAHQNPATIFVGARKGSSLPTALAGSVSLLPLDLSSLASVSRFCESVAKAGPIGRLILNAGLSPRRLETTSDGIDRAFQVNYLAHLAIILRLWDVISDTVDIIITSSGTHDPAEKTPPPPPRHADVLKLADPASDPELDRMAPRAAARSYTASKLCCTML